MTPTPILRTALIYGAILAIVIAALGSLLGYLVAGTNGLVSALIGAAVTALFMAFTAVSIIIAQRVTRDQPSIALFFGVILGAWFLKFVVFIVIVVLLRGAPFLDPMVFFVAVLAAVIGSLVVDMLAYVRSRTPYVDVELPGSE
jgi:hypothetical protein